MSKRPLVFLNVLLMALATAVLLAPVSVVSAIPAGAGDDGTEDILYMTDGRELHGHIIEETSDSVVFELVIRNTTIRTKVTYAKDQILEIERGVTVTDAAVPERKKVRTKRATSKPDEPETTYGARRAAVANANVPSFYILPMKGQMGTDINSEVYEDIVDDIRAHNPDVLVIEMECRDNEDLLYSMIGREERGLPEFDEFRKLIAIFHDELSDVRQVLWVKDSVGVSSVVAMAWDEIYMSPEARLGGLNALQDIGFEKWSDEDVRGKMTAAFMAFVKGFLEHGGYAHELADAMVRPKYLLSGTWKGRDVKWTLDAKGDYVVDNDDEKTAEFRAKSAEDLCISAGTVDNLDDLALLLGMREYRVLDGDGETAFEKYREGWRRSLDNCVVWLEDYKQFMGWAGGEDELKYLGQAKGRIEKVLAAMERYSAVETRLRMEHQVTKFDLETLVAQQKERIRALRQRDRGGRGRGGRGAPGAGAGSGG